MVGKTKKNSFKRKTIIKKALKLLIIVFFISISVKIYFVCMQNLESEDEFQALQKELSELINENKNLKNEIDTGLTPDFVEKTAREKLKMVNPNERVFFNIVSEN